jgi:hypothetical protein
LALDSPTTTTTTTTATTTTTTATTATTTTKLGEDLHIECINISKSNKSIMVG